MNNVAGEEAIGNASEVVRDGRDVVLMQGDKQLGFATYCHDSVNLYKSCFVANANQRKPGWACVTVREFRRLRDALNFIRAEGVAL